MKIPMGPPPPKEPKIHGSTQSDPNEANQQGGGAGVDEAATTESTNTAATTSTAPPTTTIITAAAIIRPYSIPPWSEAPGQPYCIEVLKDGAIVGNLDVSQKGAYMFGRGDQCDFVLEHPTVSRYHAVLQYKGNGDAFLYDLGSTHGSFVNKNQVGPKVYQQLHVGDVIRFGCSSRLYILQGPVELMPPEKSTHGAMQSFSKIHNLEEMADMEASLLRAQREASLADGISWGMMEDAFDVDTKEEEEITWQTYKGELTDKQKKTRDKVIKRNEKLANLKKEIDAIQAKEIAQGGLTQGQQTQIARNELRIQQIAEELESLEETLNESIQESVGARAGRVGSRKKGIVEDGDEVQSDDDDDEFYDRTKKEAGTGKKAEEQQTVETAETLLEKKENIAKEIENAMASLQAEDSNDKPQQAEGSLESEDPLDAFMTGLSSQIGKDRTTKLKKKLETLQSEMDRIIFLLKIADPTGEASRKILCSSARVHAGQMLLGSASKPVNKENSPDQKNQVKLQRGSNAIISKISEERNSLPTGGVDPKASEPEINIIGGSGKEEKSISKDSDEERSTNGVSDKHTSAPTKQRWLGAVHNTDENEDNKRNFICPDSGIDSGEFVGYKDRKKALLCNEEKTSASILEDAKGLVIRKPKEMDRKSDPGKLIREGNEGQNSSSTTTAMVAETSAEDAVALLLRHKRGLTSSNENDERAEEDLTSTIEPAQKRSKKLGPEKPSFLTEDSSNYDAWIPPQGQTGDGRTSLNDKYGY